MELNMAFEDIDICDENLKRRNFPEYIEFYGILENLDFAFQPIINPHNNICLGFEALLRGYEKIGFSSIEDFFDFAYENRFLYTTDLILREKAVIKFKKIKFHKQCKLFYNIDNRVLMMPNYSPGNTEKILQKHNFDSSNLCFEISERHEIKNNIAIKNTLDTYQSQNYNIAIDDYGAGFSGLKLLYFSEPDYIKIDGFFIRDIHRDYRKRLFVSKLIEMAHILGIMVIAEGVETEEEFLECRDVNCDFVQGYYIQKPSIHISEFRLSYEKVDFVKRKFFNPMGDMAPHSALVIPFS